jgi:hypothetical protein
MKELKGNGNRPALNAGFKNSKNVAVFQHDLHIKAFTSANKRADFHFI